MHDSRKVVKKWQKNGESFPIPQNLWYKFPASMTAPGGREPAGRGFRAVGRTWGMSGPVGRTWHEAPARNGAIRCGGIPDGAASAARPGDGERHCWLVSCAWLFRRGERALRVAAIASTEDFAASLARPGNGGADDERIGRRIEPSCRCLTGNSMESVDYERSNGSHSGSDASRPGGRYGA